MDTQQPEIDSTTEFENFTHERRQRMRQRHIRRVELIEQHRREISRIRNGEICVYPPTQVNDVVTG